MSQEKSGRGEYSTGEQFASTAELDVFCRESYGVRTTVRLDEERTGLFEIKSLGGSFDVYIPYIGYVRSESRVREEEGLQVLNFAPEKYRMLLAFLLNREPFEFKDESSLYSKIFVRGITEAEEGDFLPVPRLELQISQLEHNDQGVLEESKHTVQYMEVSEQFRTQLKSKIQKEIDTGR